MLLASLALAAIGATTAVAPANGATPAPATNAVARLYADCAWEAKADGQRRTGLLESGRPVLARYFTPGLTRLLLADRACVRRTKELCNLNWLPHWDSQDPEGAVPRVLSPANPHEIPVEIAYSGGSEHHLTYVLEATPSGDRIANIRARNWSLVAILSPKQ
jgi:hypothetical protein